VTKTASRRARTAALPRSVFACVSGSLPCAFREIGAVLAVLLLTLLFPPSASALDPAAAVRDYAVTEWRTKDGLAYPALRSVQQSGDGYLWIATRAGLSRFDGLNFTVVSPASVPILATEDTYNLWFDGERTLWISTSKGIVWYRDGEWLLPPFHAEIADKQAMGCFRDRDGSIVFAVTGALYRYTPKDAHRLIAQLGSRTREHAIAQAYSFCRTPEGELLVAGLGLGRLRDGNIEPYDLRDTFFVETRALAMDREGGMWVGSSTGLQYWKNGATRSYTAREGLPSNAVRSLLVDRDQNVWVGTANGLARYANGRFERVVCAGRTLAHVLTLAEDREGNIWVGTDNGLYRVRDMKFATMGENEGLPVKAVLSVLQARDGTRWVGTWGGGLLHIGLHGQTRYSVDEGLLEQGIVALDEDATGGLWIAYNSRYVSYLKEGKFTHHRDEGVARRVRAVRVDARGDVWLAGRTGLMKLVGTRFEAVPTPGVEEAKLLAIGADGTLYTAGLKGIGVLRDGQWQSYPTPSGEPQCMFTDARGDLWIAYDGCRLLRLRDGQLQNFAVPEVLGPLVYGGFEYNGELWINFRSGVTRIPLTELDAVAAGEKKMPAFTLYTESDGLPSLAPNISGAPGAAAMRDGSLWFSSAGGIAMIDPRRIRHNTLPPPVVIERVLVDKKQFGLRELQNISPGRGELAVHFTALSLTSAAENRFKYRLVGFDRDWIEAGNRREANYGGLPPKTYRFEVIAANNEGVWNTTGATVDIRIPPHFYQTWWFWAIAGVVAAGLFVGAVALRTRLHRLREAELVRLVHERTQDLERAKEVAEAASRSKSEFVANMSHEIRTPMNGVMGMIELAQDLATSPDEKDYLRTALSSGEALLSVINDILDFSKIESGKMDLDPVPFNLTTCIENAVETVSVKAAQKHLELVCDIDPRTPIEVVGDGSRLRQVLLNLLGNALKFTEHGEVVVRVEPEAGEPGKVRVTVSDTGIGIPAHRLDAIFESFVQVDTSTTRRYGGTGLGLTISRRLVQMMGGRIWVESTLGQGSRFIFTVSLPASANTSPGNDVPTMSVLHDRTVLIVDDSATNRVILGDMTRLWLMHPTLAGSANEALALIEERAQKNEGPFDLILTDVHMPNVDGLQLVKAIKALKGYASIPIVVLSSGEQLIDSNRCAELGIAMFLRKPVMRSRLFERLQKVVHQSHPPMEVAPASVPRPQRTLNILLAEDSAVNQLVARKILEKVGHRVDIAGTGAAAVAKFQQGKYDAILMDVHMPEMDGLEASQQIRHLEARSGRHIPIIALTANAMKGDDALCLNAGMDAYLTKPLRSQELYALLDRMLPVSAADAVLLQVAPAR
jgi:signal transduction histidine kinase/CheY-like chemotaxis protein/ligand-binding sensor domain-containing protein